MFMFCLGLRGFHVGLPRLFLFRVQCFRVQDFALALLAVRAFMVLGLTGVLGRLWMHGFGFRG